MIDQRKEREKRCAAVSQSDQRSPFARDRDRILYSSAFHRLAGVTQIVKAGEQDVFHTRQQHTYKVAQVGRRLAEYCKEQALYSELELFVEPEVVEAACLAHDLGHPPFGHAAEKELDKLVRGEHLEEAPDPAIYDEDGFEGNAQTFRILTKLAVRYDVQETHGLDLTRATLQAVLKYPWLRDLSQDKKRDKWSAYSTEKSIFEWATEHSPSDTRSDEAELMDWADDIAYSVHDLEDFHRVGVIPWHIILAEDRKGALINAEQLINDALGKWFGAPVDAKARMRQALERISDTMFAFPAVAKELYDGQREQRRQLRNLTSIWIGRYIQSVQVQGNKSGAHVVFEEEAKDDVRMLKHFARHYVIGLPALAAQQFGQRKIVRDLFEVFLERGLSGKLDLLPSRLRYIWEDHRNDKPARLAADCITCLTENEAHKLHVRLTGADSGSVLDPIVR